MLNKAITNQLSCYLKIYINVFILCFFLFFLILFLGGNVSLSVLNIVSIICTLWVVKRFNNFPLFQFVLLFCSLFPFYTLAYTLFKLPISDYTLYQSDELIFQFLLIHTVFFIGISFGWDSTGGKKNITPQIEKIRSKYLKLFMTFFLFVCVALFKGENIFLSDNPYYTYTNNLEVESGLPEYVLILVLFQFLIKSDSRMINSMAIFSVVFYCYSLIIMGYRVQFLMLVLMVFFYYFENRIKPVTPMILFLFGFVLFSVLGYVKDGGLENINFSDVFFDDRPGFVLSHHTGVIYSSLAVIGSIDDEKISFLDRAYSFLGLSLNTLTPSGIVNNAIPQSNMSLYIKQFTRTAGGIYVPVTIFVYSGVLGVFIFGVLLSRLYLIATNSNKVNTFAALFSFFTLITFPRWVSYDLGNFFFRLPIYCLVFYIFLILLKNRKARVG